MSRPAEVAGRHAVLYPAIAAAADRVGAATVGLVDVGNRAGFNLHVDRVGITYSDGPFLGSRASGVQVTAAIAHGRVVPAHTLPAVMTRIGLHPDPPDLAGLRAAAPPPDRDMLEAEIALAATVARHVLTGNVLERLPEALDLVPADVLPVVTTTWTLSRLTLEQRLRFLQTLGAAATHRTVAWVSVEGVGVGPSVPTFGDRPASGHSIIGIALFDHRTLSAEGVGRCWSRGRVLEWLGRSLGDMP